MREFVVDVLEKSLSIDEASIYYSKSISEMNNEERISYLENENKYIDFFEKLYLLSDKKIEVKINNFNSSDINEFFDEEKINVLNELKKLELENIIMKKKIIPKKFEDVVYILKLSYRDYLAGSGKIEIFYSNIGIKFFSNSDYIYIMESNCISMAGIEKIAKESDIYLKELGN